MLILWCPLMGNDAVLEEKVNRAALTPLGTAPVFENGSGVISNQAPKFSSITGGYEISEKISFASCLNHYTISFWFKQDGSSSGNKQLIFGRGDLGTAPSATSFGLWMVNHQLFFDGKNILTIPDPTIVGNWNHIVFSYEKNGNSYCLLNGELLEGDTEIPSTSSFGSDDTNIAAKIHIGGDASANQYPGWLQDIRVYDEALSLYEMKQLFKPVVCHYGCEHNEFTTNLLYADGKEPTASLYNNTPTSLSGSIQKLNETYMGYPVWRLTFSTSSSTDANALKSQYSGHGCYFQGQWFNDANPYNFSFLFRKVTHSDLDMSGVVGNIEGWSLASNDGEYFQDGWYFHSQYRTAMGSKADMPFCVFKCPSYQVNETLIVDVTAPVLTKYITDAQPGTVANSGGSSISDESGFGNNATAFADNRTPMWQPPVQGMDRGSYKYTGSKALKLPESLKLNKFTINIWANADDWGEDGQLISCTNAAGFAIGQYSGEDFAFKVRANGASGFTMVQYPMDGTGWRMITLVASPDGVIGYVNGNQVGTAAGVTSLSYDYTAPVLIGAESAPNNAIEGVYFSGLIGDFQMFAGALSAAEVKSLYEKSASIIKTGGLVSNHFVENTEVGDDLLGGAGDFSDPSLWSIYGAIEDGNGGESGKAYKITGNYGGMTSTFVIPVEEKGTYEISVLMKNNPNAGAEAYIYFSVMPLDVNYKEITVREVNTKNSKIAICSSGITNGATSMTVDDATSFIPEGHNATLPPIAGIYDRACDPNCLRALKFIELKKDTPVTGNTLNFNSAYTGETISGPFYTRYTVDGSTWIYPMNMKSTSVSTSYFTKYTGTISELRPETRYIKIYIFTQNGQSPVFSNLKLYRLDKPQKFSISDPSKNSILLSKVKNFSVKKEKFVETENYSTCVKGRYVRAYLQGGSGSGSTSTWKQLQVFNEVGECVSFGLPVTSNGTPALSGGDSVILKRWQDRPTDTQPNSDAIITISNASENYIQVDLGRIFNISEIKLWNHTDGRVYSRVRVAISENGTDYINVFDTDIEGTYAETAEGKQIYVTPKKMSIGKDGYTSVKKLIQ